MSDNVRVVEQSDGSFELFIGNVPVPIKLALTEEISDGYPEILMDDVDIPTNIILE